MLRFFQIERNGEINTNYDKRDAEAVVDLIQHIQNSPSVEKCIVGGSAVEGTGNFPDSDIDVKVIMNLEPPEFRKQRRKLVRNRHYDSLLVSEVDQDWVWNVFKELFLAIIEWDNSKFELYPIIRIEKTTVTVKFHRPIGKLSARAFNADQRSQLLSVLKDIVFVSADPISEKDLISDLIHSKIYDSFPVEENINKCLNLNNSRILFAFQNENDPVRFEEKSGLAYGKRVLGAICIVDKGEPYIWVRKGFDYLENLLLKEINGDSENGTGNSMVSLDFAPLIKSPEAQKKFIRTHLLPPEDPISGFHEIFYVCRLDESRAHDLEKRENSPEKSTRDEQSFSNPDSFERQVGSLRTSVEDFHSEELRKAMDKCPKLRMVIRGLKLMSFSNGKELCGHVIESIMTELVFKPDGLFDDCGGQSETALFIRSVRLITKHIEEESKEKRFDPKQNTAIRKYQQWMDAVAKMERALKNEDPHLWENVISSKRHTTLTENFNLMKNLGIVGDNDLGKLDPEDIKKLGLEEFMSFWEEYHYSPLYHHPDICPIFGGIPIGNEMLKERNYKIHKNIKTPGSVIKIGQNEICRQSEVWNDAQLVCESLKQAVSSYQLKKSTYCWILEKTEFEKTPSLRRL